MSTTCKYFKTIPGIKVVIIYLLFKIKKCDAYGSFCRHTEPVQVSRSPKILDQGRLFVTDKQNKVIPGIPSGSYLLSPSSSVYKPVALILVQTVIIYLLQTNITM